MIFDWFFEYLSKQLLEGKLYSYRAPVLVSEYLPAI